MLRLRHSANKPDAAGDRICPVCESAITITDGWMRLGDSDEIAHIRCALNRGTAAGPRTGEKRMAPLLCTCDHSRELHRYERHRGGGWTVCRACRCVRFTDRPVDLSLGRAYRASAGRRAQIGA